jgi:hypothetical protein
MIMASLGFSSSDNLTCDNNAANNEYYKRYDKFHFNSPALDKLKKDILALSPTARRRVLGVVFSVIDI